MRKPRKALVSSACCMVESPEEFPKLPKPGHTQGQLNQNLGGGTQAFGPL